jgi:hypothetical protein
MSVVERHWIELFVLAAAFMTWVAYRRAFAHVPVHRRDGEDSGT